MPGAQFFGHGSSQLDRQIRDTFRGVHLVRSRKRVRRASVEAARTGAAVVGAGHDRAAAPARSTAHPETATSPASHSGRTCSCRSSRCLNTWRRCARSPGRYRRNTRCVEQAHRCSLHMLHQTGLQCAQFLKYHIVVVALRPSVTRDPALRGKPRHVTSKARRRCS